MSLIRRIINQDDDMTRFSTITLKAQKLFDPETGKPNTNMICRPLETFLQDPEVIPFREGDSAILNVEDGSRFEFIFENEQWSCYGFHADQQTPGAFDSSLLNPCSTLEDALVEFISRRKLFNLN